MKDNEYLDAFGTPLGVGDIILGAVGKRGSFTETRFNFNIITDTTRKMIKIFPLGINKGVLDVSNETLLESFVSSGLTRGFSLHPVNFVYIKSTGLTPEDFKKSLGSKKKDTTPLYLPL